MMDQERSADCNSNNSNSSQLASPTDHGRGQGADPRTPRYQELEESPGIEVIEASTLEVVAPQAPQLPLPPPSATTWEKKPYVFDYGASPQTPYSATAAAFSLHSGYEQAPLTGYPPTPVEKRIAGLKRQTFFIVLAIGVFIAVVGIAAGVGVGIALGKNNNQQSISPAARAFPLPTAQATTGPDRAITCPANNLTLYTSQADKSKRFTLLCGRDYNSGQGTLDMYNQEAATMGECIDMCAGQIGCVGVGWGWYQSAYVCWLKSYLAKPQPSALWYFAALDNVTGLNLPEARSKRGERRNRYEAYGRGVLF